MITIVNGKVMTITQGTLEPGKDADLVVFDGHPFDYRTVVDLVLVDGQVAYRREEGNGQS